MKKPLPPKPVEQLGDHSFLIEDLRIVRREAHHNLPRVIKRTEARQGLYDELYRLLSQKAGERNPRFHQLLLLVRSDLKFGQYGYLTRITRELAAEFRSYGRSESTLSMIERLLRHLAHLKTALEALIDAPISARSVDYAGIQAIFEFRNGWAIEPTKLTHTTRPATMKVTTLGSIQLFEPVQNDRTILRMAAAIELKEHLYVDAKVVKKTLVAPAATPSALRNGLLRARARFLRQTLARTARGAGVQSPRPANPKRGLRPLERVLLSMDPVESVELLLSDESQLERRALRRWAVIAGLSPYEAGFVLRISSATVAAWLKGGGEQGPELQRLAAGLPRSTLVDNMSKLRAVEYPSITGARTRK